MPAQEHPYFEPPETPDARIARYMTLGSFMAMVQEGALFFANISKFNDPFEGSVPASHRSRNEYSELDKNGRWIGDPFPEEVRELRKHLVVSCWHLAEQESAAMWRQYGASEEVVCVKSTFAKLKAALPETFAVGRVKYIDFDRDCEPIVDPLQVMLLKRLSYDYEKEVRAIDISEHRTRLLSDTKAPGVWQPVDLASLIESVSTAPAAVPWLNSVVFKSLIKYGYRIHVEPSTLDAQPYE